MGSKLYAFLLQGFRISWSYKLNFISRYFSLFVSLLLYFFLAKLVNRPVAGGSYFSFLLIGGVFARFLNLSMRAFSINIREEMMIGTIEPLLTTSMPTALALLGPATWGLIEGTLIVIVQLLLGIKLGANFSQANWFAGILILLLSLTSLVGYGIFSAAFLIVYKRSDPINFVIQAVVQVFSGVYFPIESLPPVLRFISYLLPFTYAIKGLRGAIIHGNGLADLRSEIIALLIFTTIILPVAIFTLRYAINHLRERGGLGHY